MQDKYKPQDKYSKANCTGVYLKLNKKLDSDILEYLSGIENKQGLIKALIRAQMAADGIAAAIAPAQEDNTELLPEWED